MTINERCVSPLALAILAIVSLIGAAPVSSQSPVFVDVTQCRNIQVDLVRVACYDTLADQALVRGAMPAVTESATPQNTGQTDLNRQLLEQNWQMRAELARLRKGSQTDQTNGGSKPFGGQEQGIVKSDDGDEEFYDRITSLQKIPAGWIVTLANGQVWRQMYSRNYALREGQEVKMSPTIWGSSYRLSVSDLGGFIQVERVR